MWHSNYCSPCKLVYGWKKSENGDWQHLWTCRIEFVFIWHFCMAFNWSSLCVVSAWYHFLRHPCIPNWGSTDSRTQTEEISDWICKLQELRGDKEECTLCWWWCDIKQGMSLREMQRGDRELRERPWCKPSYFFWGDKVACGELRFPPRAAGIGRNCASGRRGI